MPVKKKAASRRGPKKYVVKDGTDVRAGITMSCNVQPEDFHNIGTRVFIERSVDVGESPEDVLDDLVDKVGDVLPRAINRAFHRLGESDYVEE